MNRVNDNRKANIPYKVLPFGEHLFPLHMCLLRSFFRHGPSPGLAGESQSLPASLQSGCRPPSSAEIVPILSSVSPPLMNERRLLSRAAHLGACFLCSVMGRGKRNNEHNLALDRVSKVIIWNKGWNRAEYF